MKHLQLDSFSKDSFTAELEQHILPFWEHCIDEVHGGFYGRVDGRGTIYQDASKGAVLNARILWTFSAAYRVLKKQRYRELADRAFQYFTTYFLDKKYGGVYWELDSKGNPINRKKQTYAQGFALYAFSEYYRATEHRESLDLAIAFFERIEQCRDQEQGGYWEAFSENWNPIDDMRLSEKDENTVKSMNTHLHILEPYTNLLRIWPDPRLALAQKDLIDIFLEKIYNPDNHHLKLFFDSGWHAETDIISYGHDIEASWLLMEAANVLDDAGVTERVKEISLRIASAASEGILPDGSLAYERTDSGLDKERHWWVQAEGVVGFFDADQRRGDGVFTNLAKRLWQYIQDQLVDKKEGEWYWSRRQDGSVNLADDKAGFWKCPYHNSRMCLELIEKL